MIPATLAWRVGTTFCPLHSCTRIRHSWSGTSALGFAGWLLQTKNKAAVIAARPNPLEEPAATSVEEQSVKTIASLLLTDEPRYVAHLILRVFKQRQAPHSDSTHQMTIHPAEEAAALSMLSSPEIKQLKERLEAAYAARTEAAAKQQSRLWQL